MAVAGIIIRCRGYPVISLKEGCSVDFWFGYVSLAVFVLVIWFMPKHLTRREIYITWGWMAALTIHIDLWLGNILDYYDFVGPQVQPGDLFLEATLPPSYGIITTNFMPKKTRPFLVYLLFVVIVAAAYEWLSLKTGYLVYKGWKLWYSIPVYILGTFFLKWHIGYIRKR